MRYLSGNLNIECCLLNILFRKLRTDSYVAVISLEGQSSRPLLKRITKK